MNFTYINGSIHLIEGERRLTSPNSGVENEAEHRKPVSKKPTINHLILLAKLHHYVT